MIYKVAYITLGQEHDEYAYISKALKVRNIECELLHLNEVKQVDWQQYDLVSLRMCRGLHLDSCFIEKVKGLQAHLLAIKGKTIPLYNPLKLLEVALDKYDYLRALEQQGVNIVPTRWISQKSGVTLETILDEEGWDDIVLKPTKSTLCWRSYRMLRDKGIFEIYEPEVVQQKPVIQGVNNSDADFDHYIENSKLPLHEALFRALLEQGSVCVQQFMPAILDQGEWSFVFLADQYSHAIHKEVKAGDGWVAHEVYGGTNAVIEANQQQIHWATSIYRILTQLYGDILYARVDGIPDSNGDLKLLECELVVPRLFLKEGGAINRYADMMMTIIKESRTQ